MANVKLVTKEELLTEINKNNLNQNCLNRIHDIVVKNSPDKRTKYYTTKKKTTDEQIDKTSEKYKVALKFVNKILVNIGKTEITDLIEFKNINKNDIVKEDNMKYVTEMSDEIFKYYDKVRCGYYYKNRSKRYILRIIEAMCEDIGHQMVYTRTSKQVKTVQKTLYLYCIE
jgi:hypothetical protein